MNRPLWSFMVWRDRALERGERLVVASMDRSAELWNWAPEEWERFRVRLDDFCGLLHAKGSEARRCNCTRPYDCIRGESEVWAEGEAHQEPVWNVNHEIDGWMEAGAP